VAAHAEGLTVLTFLPDVLEAFHAAGVRACAAVSRRPSTGFETLRKTARRLNAPLVAVPGSFFVDPEDHEAHRVLRAIALNSTLSRLGSGDAAPPEAWLADAAEYRRRFEIEPEMIAATEAIAERCAFTGPPRTAVFPQWRDPSGQPTAQVLRDLAYAGAAERYGNDLPENIVERIEHELSLIERKGFSDYFLVVREIVRRSPRTCGRGSGAASIVAYCLGITNVCPVKFNLYFERFLNPGRTDPPDIDVDFAWDERDAVLASVLGQHAGHSAMVSNHVFFQPRMLLREIAKVLGVPDGEIKRVLDRLPFFLREDQGDADLDEQLERLPPLRPEDFPPPWPEILRLAGGLTGTPRNLSVHPGGVVITPRPIAEYVPLEPAAKGVAIVQWEKDGSETGGLVKIDLLGNRSLAVIRDALAAVNAARETRPPTPGQGPPPIDELKWQPEDDPATQANVAAGRTMGCFYIESPAMRLLQQKTQRGDYAHLVIHSSIIRPAANEYIREYVRRLRGGAWEPMHPLLTDVLSETYGIMVYQEHVALASMALAGFSHEEADRLRKIISKKDRERHLPDFKQRFADGAQARGVSDEVIEQVWRMMMSFAGYSFCKPHSASYARVSFQAAWLKTHCPAEFMAAVISNQGGFYSTFAYVSEARRLGLTLRPPDVNLSGFAWTGHTAASPSRGTLRVGLMAVKHLSDATARRIVERREGRPYADMHDFLTRVEADEEEVRSLIHAGACDALRPGADRATLLWEAAAWKHHGRRKKAGRDAPSLFDEPGAPALAASALPDLPKGTELERLRLEFSALGFLCGRHPMALYEDVLRRRRPIKARDLSAHVGRRVTCAGWLITGKVVSTREGEPMEFLTFEDETGTIETTFFPGAYRRHWDQLQAHAPCLFHGLVAEDFGAITLTVERMERLGAAPSKT
jgi:DNA polymerase-3 subunit alpha/error-prone DNA polymerase